MTYWHLLVLALVCTVLALALVVGTDLFDTGSGIRDLGAFLATIVLGIGALCTGVGFISGNLDRAACLEHAERSGESVEYKLLSGCYIRVDGRLVPYDRWVEVSGTGAP